MTQRSTSSLRRQLEDHLDLVEQILHWTSRRQRFSPEDAEELRSIVFLKLVQDDYAVLRKFEGKSSMRTYLTTVIQRLALDYRNRKWGKWRPSAAARRLGDTALLLEKLVARDCRPTAEAIEILLRNHRIETSRAELEGLSARLPVRRSRRDDVELPADLAAGEQADTALWSKEKRSRLARARKRLGRLMQSLPSEDRLILKLRFEQRLPISKIAPRLGLDQRPLYRRVRRCLDELRRDLEAQGISSEVLAEAC